MTALPNSVGKTDEQGTAVAGRPAHRHVEAREHDHSHGHAHPDVHAHGHTHSVRAGIAAAAAPRVRHSMFLASALERLVIAVVLVALIWAGILWAIA